MCDFCNNKIGNILFFDKIRYISVEIDNNKKLSVTTKTDTINIDTYTAAFTIHYCPKCGNKL